MPRYLIPYERHGDASIRQGSPRVVFPPTGVVQYQDLAVQVCFLVSLHHVVATPGALSAHIACPADKEAPIFGVTPTLEIGVGEFAANKVVVLPWEPGHIHPLEGAISCSILTLTHLPWHRHQPRCDPETLRGIRPHCNSKPPILVLNHVGGATSMLPIRGRPRIGEYLGHILLTRLWHGPPEQRVAQSPVPVPMPVSPAESGPAVQGLGVSEAVR
mmetsp:Transcript_135002/g.320048  ORF Transcript_135002/g.320048 Transcript_135002/m.320048 type:complete len:216 (-) Transcript_135002:2107-2754(-)